MNPDYFPVRRWVLRAICWVFAVYLVAPPILAIPFAFSADSFLKFPPSGLSLQWFDSILSDPKWLDGALLSLKVGAVAVCISVPLGVATGYGLARLGGRISGMLYGLTLAPMIIPVIVTALALYYAFAQVHIVGSWIAISIGHAVIGMPLVVITTTAGMNAIPVGLERAARTLGATRAQTIGRIVLPLISGPIAIGTFLAFMASFDDLLISLFLARVGSRTLPLVMWSAATEQVDPTLSAVSVILMTFTVGLFALAFTLPKVLQKRRATRMTRLGVVR